MKSHIAFVFLIAVTLAGCSYSYIISVSGIVLSKDGKPLRDVMISEHQDVPGPAEKWTGPDGTFTPCAVRFGDHEFDGNKLLTKSMWFVKEGYETKKIDIQYPWNPRQKSERPKAVRLNIVLEEK